MVIARSRAMGTARSLEAAIGHPVVETGRSLEMTIDRLVVATGRSPETVINGHRVEIVHSREMMDGLARTPSRRRGRKIDRIGKETTGMGAVE